MLIDFWGTWCPGCVPMIPHQQELVRRLADEPFALLGVNCDGPRERAAQLFEKHGVTRRNAIDVEQFGPWGSTWNITAWPSLFLIDAEGVIRERWTGTPGADILDARIDELLAEARAANE